MTPNHPVTIRKPSSPLHGRAGRVVRDGGVAEAGPDKGKRFWWVMVEGSVWPYPYLFHEGELA